MPKISLTSLFAWLLLLGLSFPAAGWASSVKYCCQAGPICSCDSSHVRPAGKSALAAPNLVRREKITRNVAALNLKTDAAASPTTTPLSLDSDEIDRIFEQGTSQVISSDTTNFTMDVGTANSTTAQLWNMPSHTTWMYSYRMDNISPAAVPSSGFSGYTHVQRWLEGADTVLIYYDLNAEDATEVGYWEHFGGDSIYTEQTMDYISEFPVDLGDSFISEYTEDDTGTVTLETLSYVDIDAFGTLQTPWGLIPVLRFFSTDSTFHIENGMNIDTTLTTSIGWVGENGFRYAVRLAEGAPTSGQTAIDGAELEQIQSAPTLEIPDSTYTCAPVSSEFADGTGGWVHFFLDQKLAASVENIEEMGQVSGYLFSDADPATPIRTTPAGAPVLDRNFTLVPETQPTDYIYVWLYITQAEFDALNAASATVSQLSDLRVIRKAGTACTATAFPTFDETYVPDSVYVFAPGVIAVQFETDVLGQFQVVGKASTAIEHTTIEDAVSVYPIPASDLLMVRTTVPAEAISLTDLAGRRMEVAANLQDNQEYQLDIQHLEPGVYHLSVWIDGIRTVYPVVVQ